MRGREGQVGAAIVLALVASPARAETVLLLRAAEGRWRAAEERTRDELRFMGLEVEELASPREPELTRVMAERGAQAAVLLQRRGDVADAQVWSTDARGELHSQRIDALTLGGEAAATLAALRTAELVHAGVHAPASAPVVVADLEPVVSEAAVLVPAPLVPMPVAAPVVVEEKTLEVVIAGLRPAAAPPPPSLPPHRGTLGGYATLGGGPGGAGLLVGGAVALRWELGRVVAMQGELSVTTTAVAISTDSGSIRAGLFGGRATVVVEPWRAARVSPRLGLGGGVALSWATGRATSPLRGGSDLAGVGLLGGSLGAAVRLRPRLRLYLGVDLLFTAPAIALRVTGEEVARLGAPVVQGVIGLEWGWPAPRGP